MVQWSLCTCGLPDPPRRGMERHRGTPPRHPVCHGIHHQHVYHVARCQICMAGRPSPYHMPMRSIPSYIHPSGGNLSALGECAPHTSHQTVIPAPIKIFLQPGQSWLLVVWSVFRVAMALRQWFIEGFTAGIAVLERSICRMVGTMKVSHITSHISFQWIQSTIIHGWI